MNPRSIILILGLCASSTNVLAGTSCRDFLVPGKQYVFEVTTTSGPVEVGRRQRFMLTAPKTTEDGSCSKVTGTYAGSWAMTLTGCKDNLTVLAVRSGEGNLTGEATCSGAVATGTLGYTDAERQTFAYDATITRQ
jgi:hypothetical protein